MVILPVDAQSSARTAGLLLEETIKLLVPNRWAFRGQEVPYWARVSLDGAKMRIDHKMVNRAPGMAASLLRRAVTYWNISTNYVENFEFAVQQRRYRTATERV
jgi:hypothetical protein